MSAKAAKLFRAKSHSRSLYDVLGVDNLATAADLRSAYRQKALLAHPDKGGRKEDFQEIVQAFETLSSSSMRQAYDRALVCYVARKRCHRDISHKDELVKMEAKTDSRHIRSNHAEMFNSTPGDEHQTDTSGNSKQPCTASKYVRSLLWLQKAIARVPKDNRKEVLQNLAANVRSALLKHLEASRASDPAASGKHDYSMYSIAPVDGSDTETTDSDLLSEQSSMACDSDSETRLALQNCPAVDDDTESDCVMQPETSEDFSVAPPGIACRPGRQSKRSASGCRGVLKDSRGKRTNYQATVTFCNICAITRCVSSLEVAIEYHTILVSLKQQILDQNPDGYSANCPELGPRIQAVVASICTMHNVPLADLALSFRVVVFAPPQFIGAKKVWGRFSIELHGVLQQRQRLLQAREQDWATFRAAWIELMQMPVTQRDSAWGSALSQPKTEAEAIAIADAAWNNHSEMRDKRAQELRHAEERKEARAEQIRLRQERRAIKKEASLRYRLQQVQRAAAAVERALVKAAKRSAASARANAVQTRLRALKATREERQRLRQEKLERERLWAWHRDPSRTFEEIMKGPPKEFGNQ